MLLRLLADTSAHPIADEAWGESLRPAFEQDAVLVLRGLFSGAGLAMMQAEIKRLRSHAIRRDFVMDPPHGTARHMSTLGSKELASLSSMVPMLYEDPDLRRLVSNVFGVPVSLLELATYPYGLNDLHLPGDVHGTHLDDYPVTVIFAFDTPERDGGGVLEYVKDAESPADLETKQVRRLQLSPGDCYLLRADTTAHRVSPLRTGRRTVLSCVYGSPGHETSSLLTEDRLYASAESGDSGEPCVSPKKNRSSP